MCDPCYQQDYHKRNREARNARKRIPESEYAGNYRKPPRKSPTVPECGHPDRKAVARKMCNACYQQARRDGTVVIGMATCHPDRPELAKQKCHQCYGRDKYWSNPERFAEVSRERQAVSRKRNRDELIAAYGGKCACPRCPEANQAFLTLEHVGGGGRAHRKAVGSHSYADLRRRGYPQEGFTLLCWNCNAASRLTGVCPHMLDE
jgi:hypothetical protein